MKRMSGSEISIKEESTIEKTIKHDLMKRTAKRHTIIRIR